MDGQSSEDVTINMFYAVETVNRVDNMVDGQSLVVKAQAGKQVVFVSGNNFTVSTGYLLLSGNATLTITRTAGVVSVSGEGVTMPGKALLVDHQDGHGNYVANAFKANFPGWEDVLVLGMSLYNPYNQFTGLISYAIAARMKSAFVPYAIPPANIESDTLGQAAWERGMHVIQATSNSNILSPPNGPIYSVVMTSGTSSVATRAQSLGMDFWDIHNSNSPATGVVAAKLIRVLLGRNDGVWAARYAARMTAIRNETTHPGGVLWNQRHGFGRIDVDAAIAWTGEVPPDPFLNDSNVYTPHVV